MREAAQALNQDDADAYDPTELQYQADMLRCIFGPLLFRQKPICEPTAHRLVQKVLLPPLPRRLKCLREPTAAA
jgi:hypothetical protein